ncbi:MAG: spore coat protein U domain-containing protein [Proteobacteria bacterium]|nr:spore coat protein U domain-containing protein [Pseudomonadota bacterium]
MIFTKPLAVACVVTASVYAAMAGTATAEFRVMVTITRSCAVAAGTVSNASLGAMDAASAVDGGGAIQVTCSNETPYHVALQSVSSPNRENLGTLPGRGSNGVSTASTGNGLTGIGNGTAQEIAVRPRVMSAKPARVSPNNHSDTVAVNVYY